MANTSRMNRLEELGRVDAEKAYTGKGKRNLRDEKKRIVRELKADGGYITKKKKPSWIKKKKKESAPKSYIKKRSRADVQEKARVKSTRGYRDGGSVMGRGQGKVMRDRPTFMIFMKD